MNKDDKKQEATIDHNKDDLVSNTDAEVEIHSLRKELEEEKAKSLEYLKKLKYLQAEFDNYKKAIDKKVDDYRKVAAESLVLELIDVHENLEKCIKDWINTKEEERLKGIKLIYDQLSKILESYGVTEIECIGQKYDPFIHEVASVIEDDQKEEDIIVDIVRKGYKLNSKVIRYPLVVVSKKRDKEVNKNV
ncbi:MAG: nucleotide exchange factor GrpE [Candidatus Methanoliparum thermophilum]|uniref:Protein GrpE n=1 Tax=Methanoliparum thermophilum TaxID=2491083 RepID=A0A520KS27_METT2|nr:nucleotide exchange factor GrpE [Candidatus Methanoliparum sp. LAM-1]RZN64557.1 MAG: nucleotide exchange factor GrpE [Candidatus Methanoliparum thermophilum]BDC35844.1 hypothetical protein MTLP_05260 [Candidatus Methanoliparum sp. LAM-1]